MKTFAIMGVGGYIAPKHLEAIKETGHKLVAAMDINDSVGVIDSYFPNSDFFVEFERFERHLEKLKRGGVGIDYLVVCTPNYLHDAHIRCGLRLGANVICEKPVVIKPHNLDAILKESNGCKIYTIMQTRLHPMIKEMQKIVEKDSGIRGNYVEVDYCTPRGRWYDYSWKGNEEKSGGLIYNIGIHFVDLMQFLFGKVFDVNVIRRTKRFCSGHLLFTNAKVKFSLSLDGDSHRQISVNGNIFDCSDGFDSLHIKCYQSIIKGEPMFLAETVRESLNIADRIRSDTPNSNN